MGRESGTGSISPARGELLRRYRLRAGLTQEQLAEQSGYSADYISKLERGRRRPPAAALNRIAAVLRLGDQERADLLATGEQAAHLESGASLLAGREHELSEIRRQLAGVGPVVLLFSGEPGIGKTRLLEEAAALAAQGGWRVIRGGCQRRAQDPYAPLAGAIADSIRQLSESDQEAALRVAGRLHLLLPELEMAGDAPPSAEGRGASASPGSQPEHEQRLLFTAVTDYLRAVAGEAGTLLVLDDLQWAGQGALDLVISCAAAAGQPREAPIRVIGAYRDTEPVGGSPLGEFVADLAGSSSAQVLTLEPLTELEAEELLLRLLQAGGDRWQALVPVIVRRSGGIPLYLVSYAEELGRRGKAEPGLDLPWTVAQVVRQRVVALPENAQELLGVAAVAGRVVQADLLGHVTSRDEEDVLQALEAAVDAYLLEDEDGGYQFVHDLVRETIEQDLSAGRRRLWHRRIGETLAHLPERRREGRAAEIAWHFLQGTDPEHALPWTLQAGDAAAAVFAHGDARMQYQKAAELALELSDETAEGEALKKLGDVLYRLGRYADALDPLERAASIYERLGERDQYLTMVARSGDAYHFSGRVAEGIDRVLPAVQALEESGLGDSPAASAADLYAALCGLYLAAGRFQEGLETANTAVSLGEATGNLRALCSSEISRGVAFGIFNRLAEQRQAYEHAAQVAERLEDPWLLASAVSNVGMSCVSMDDFEQGELLMRRALGIAERAGLSVSAAFIRSKLSELLVTRGRWTEARCEAERAEAESRSLGPRIGHTYHLAALGRILLLRGEREAGLRFLHEGLEMAMELEYPPGITFAQEILAWQEVREGKPEGAVARLEPLIERHNAMGRAWHPTVYAFALLQTGREERAAEVLHGARQAAMASPSRAGLPQVLLQSAKPAVQQGRWDDAMRDLEEGLAIAEALGLPYDQALMLEEYGRMYIARGEAEGARKRLEDALTILRRLGAVPDAERIGKALSGLAIGENAPL